MLTPLGFSLLRQLSDGAFHSGEDLAARVGLTRARVSQLLRQAETAGLSLERVRGRGYRLVAAPDFLDASAVRAALVEYGVTLAANGLSPLQGAEPGRRHRAARRGAVPEIMSRPPIHLEIVDQIDSTSSELLRRAPRRDIHGAAIAAEWQTAGRGRRGRAWNAVAGGSLTFSLGWRFEQGAGFLAGLSLAVGVGVIHALEKEGIQGVGLKWPNDLIHRHLKVGGILVELNGDALGPSTVVVGVGLNVRMPREMKRDIAQPVSDLHVGRRARRARDRPQSPARAPRRRAGGHAVDVRAAKASPRSPRNGSIATPTRASRSSSCSRTAPRCSARSPASTLAARSCSPTARGAPASSTGEISLRRA